MAYEKQTWVDRQVQYPNRYVDQNGNIVELTRSPGTITENGSLFTAERMNHIEDGVKELDNNMLFFSEEELLTTYKVLSNLLGNNTKINASEIALLNDGEVEKLDDRLKSMGLKKLWENPSPTSTFGSQNITLLSDDYDYLIWIYKFHRASNNNNQKSQFTLKGAGSIMDIAFDYSPGGGTYYIGEYYRTAKYISDKSFQISDDYVRYNSGTTIETNNDFNIPVAIYGSKF